MPVAESANGRPEGGDTATSWLFSAGAVRRRWQWLLGSGVTLLPASAAVNAWREGIGAAPILWLTAGSGLLLALWLLRELSPPAREWRVQCEQGGLFVQSRAGAEDQLCEAPQAMNAGSPRLLPGVVVLSGPQRRCWLFSDECSQTAWRRLCLCARFARQYGVTHDV